MKELPEHAVQDLLYFTKHAIRVDGNPGKTYYHLTSLSNDYLYAYIAMLEQHGFTRTEDFFESYSSGNSYASWGLVYTADPSLKTIEQMYSDTECHISMHRTKTTTGWSYRISWSPDLTMCDLGLRYGEEQPIPITPQGESVAAGLLRAPDGSYKTTDGRLSAALGTAVVLINGEQKIGTVAFETTKDGIDELTISGYNGTDQITLNVKENFMQQNNIYRFRELANTEEIKLRFVIDGKGGTIGYKTSLFDQVSLRPMYYENDGDVVYYIYGKTTDENPTEIEVLCAISTAPPPEIPFPEIDEAKLVKVKGNSSQSFTITTDQFLEIEHTYREWDSSYHTFTWEITEGEDLLLMKDVGDTATIAPLAAGQAEIKLRYGYSVIENDVLTGNPRRKSKTKTRTFTIIITDAEETE